jgi:hypothetical protein
MQSVLDAGEIAWILSGDFLRIPSEDWLVEHLISFVREDLSRLCLFEYVYFECVSVDVMQKFTGFLMSCDCGFQLGSIWIRLCRRLNCPIDWNFVPPDCPKSRFLTRVETAISPPPDGISLDGIISHLRRRFGTEKFVKASASGVSEGLPSNCIQYEKKDQSKGFCSNNAGTPWLLLEFMKASIYPTHYMIQSRDDTLCHPKSWYVEVSEDGHAWTCVDRRENDDHLVGNWRVFTFPVTQPRFGRFFRITQTSNHRGDNYMSFQKLELFGRVRERE